MTQKKKPTRTPTAKKQSAQMAKLLQEAVHMDHLPAKEAGTLAFMSRNMILATMPHSKPKELYFERRNGKFRLAMLADPRYGLPYGSLARLLLAWVTTQATVTRMPVVELEESMSGFMKELGITPTGGQTGSIKRFKDQMLRLFTTSIACTYERNERWVDERHTLAEMSQLWWNPEAPEATRKFSKVCLTESFFQELLAHPVPLDFRAIKALQKSPLAMDIYCWLTYRYHTLANPTLIPWEGLMMQFGSNYTETRQFRRKFLQQLSKVLVVYNEAKIEEIRKGDVSKGMKLWPSPTHITPIH